LLGIKKRRKKRKAGKIIECIAIGLRHLSVRRPNKIDKIVCVGLSFDPSFTEIFTAQYKHTIFVLNMLYSRFKIVSITNCITN